MYSPLLSPFPDGWYCVAFTDELAPGTVRTVPLAGQDVVLFRTRAGRLAAFDAFCPHMGAHFGHGSDVQGETLRCPFHGFCFDAAGACVQTGYGTKAPPKARVKTWPVIERHGIVFVHAGSSGRAPAYDIPDVSTDGWTSIRRRRLRFRGHVQEVAENSVDIGHLSWIHKYENVHTVSELATDGAFLTAKYGMTRPRKVFGKSGGIQTEFEIFQYGLGYARVEVAVLGLGLRTRQYVLARPVNEDEIELTLGMSIYRVERPASIHPAIFWLPKGWLTERIADTSIKEYEADVRQDLPIWANKTFIHPPALAQGDGPVGAYRRWARQFYGELEPIGA